MSELTAREERVKTLLEWWTDVREGWHEGGRGADDLGIKLMSRAYNHPSYRELERCLHRLRDEEGAIYWHVSQQYEAPNRTVLACPKCGETCEVASRWYDQRGNVIRRHKHGDVVFWVRKVVPSVNAAVRPEVVTAGIKWIAARFTVEPFIPDELLAREKAA